MEITVYLPKNGRDDMKLKFKLFFFLHYFANGIMGPYMAVFLSQKTFSGAQIGLYLGVMPITSLLFQPLWSYLSDVLNKRRILLVIGSLGVGFASFGLGLAESYTVLFLCGLFFSAMFAPISPISTAIVLDYLEEKDQSDEFSLIRLWGSLGFAASSILIGGLFIDEIMIYFSTFLGGIYLLLAVISLLLPERGKPFAYLGLKGLGKILKNRDFTIFVLGSFFIGATLGICLNYQTLFLQSLTASSWLIGFIVSIQALIEIPMMMAVPYLLRRYSMRWLILIGALILPLRWLLYIFIKNPIWVIPTQLINGISTISFYVVAIVLIDKLVSPKWRATGQGLYSTIMSGLGSGLGVFLAGGILGRFGVRSIWYLNLVLGLVGLILLIYALRRSEETSEPTKNL